MRLDELITELLKQSYTHRNATVRLVINSVAYKIEDVWWEPKQEETGAVCIGDDPR